MSDELFSVRDRVTLVSGGSRGIGRAIAAAFAQRGAKVVICGRDADTLKATAQEISTPESQVAPIVCDVADVKAIDALVAETLKLHGRIDTLINVAGVNRRKKVEQFTPEDYDFILDINLRGSFFLAQAVGKHMLERGQGNQINIASLNTDRPLKGVLAYGISKAGIGSMTRGMAIEWGPRGVRVNAIAPGFILTDLTNKLWSLPHMQAWNQQNCPLGRLGVPDDMVGTALFLASDASRFMTGQTLYVDGGVTAGVCWPIEL
jgi:gluconate 5-dehydrogenase